VDVRSGNVKDVFRMQASDMEYPFSVGVSAKQFALTSWFTGTVQVVDRTTRKTTTMIHGLKAPMDALFMDDGSLVFNEIATGSITRASGADFKDRKVIAQGLAGPVQMTMGRDGAIYITEAAGNLTRINIADGSKTVVTDKLALPEGVAQTPWGSFIVAEAAARRLVEINATDGTRRTVADNLPIGLEAGPGLPPPYVPTGVAVSAAGVIYVSADRNNAIYQIKPKR
jgi:DNA-binding beta-propeller fold protein YncE